MYKTKGLANTRIDVADALRGIAVMGIILYHSVEHFDTLNFDVTHSFPFDEKLFDILGIILSGKMYSIFALLFGLSFFIQRDNQAIKGRDFSLRFLWRMILLMGFGMINLGFYNGDILTSYAIFGLLLIPAGYLSTPVLAIITGLLLIQPINLFNIIAGNQIDYTPVWDAYDCIASAHRSGTFIQNFTTDLKYGLFFNLGWDLFSGRVTQIPGLFFLGMLLGRTRMFYNEGNHLRIWKVICAVTAVGTVAGIIAQPFGDIEEWLKPIFNVTMMMFYVSLVVILWYSFEKFAKFLSGVSFFGRMSLTNYFLQSIIGSAIFYNFGLGFWQVTGTLYSLIIGAGIVTLQFFLLKLWAKSHRRGPLEGLWRQLTWIGSQSTN